MFCVHNRCINYRHIVAESANKNGDRSKICHELQVYEVDEGDELVALVDGCCLGLNHHDAQCAAALDEDTFARLRRRPAQSPPPIGGDLSSLRPAGLAAAPHMPYNA